MCVCNLPVRFILVRDTETVGRLEAEVVLDEVPAGLQKNLWVVVHLPQLQFGSIFEC